MKWLILFLISTQIFAEQIIEFKFSKPHGIFEFYTSLIDLPHSSKVLLESYKNSKLNTPQNTKLIEESKSAINFLSVNYSFSSITKTRKNNRSIIDQFKIQSILSSDLDDFKSRTIGLIDQSEHIKLFETLKKLEEIYTDLIWNPLKPQIDQYIQLIDQVANKIKLENLFFHALAFYKSEWSVATPFVVGLHPLPGTNGNSVATSLGPVQSVAVFLSTEDLNARIGVIFHEICHSLYKTQSEETKLSIEKYFLDQKNPNANFTYNFLNEAMATAIGNGIIYQTAQGVPDKGEWYNNQYIDKFSKAIFENTKTYFFSKKPIDEYYLQNAATQFKKIFPNAHKDFENLFNEYMIISEDKAQFRTFMAKSQKTFNSRSIYANSPLTSETTKEELQNFIPGTIIIYLKDGEENKFEKLSQNISWLAEFNPLVAKTKKPFFLTNISSNYGTIIIVRLHDEKDEQKFFDILKSQRYLEDKNQFVFL